MNIGKTALLIGLMTALFMGVGLLVGGGRGMGIAFLVAVAANLFAYWNADRIVLRLHNAEEVDSHTAPDYYRIVERLAGKAGLPMPRVYVLHEDQPNAFATGRNPENAAVAATTGLLARLTPDEIAGVMAHELAHIQNRDTLIMTITATLAGAISMLGNVAYLFGGSHPGNRNPLGAIGALLGIMVAPFAAMLVQMAISRTREYAADRRGAEISGQPMALASALAKIAGAAGRTVNLPAERNPATAHLFIVNPLNGRRLDGLFSTHPATENRIEALRAMTDIAAPPRAERLAQPSGGSGPWSRGARARSRVPLVRRGPAPRGPSPRGPWG